MNMSNFRSIFQFHKVHNLSSTVLTGFKFMVNFGCNIRANFWPPFSFQPYKAYLVSLSLKTIFYKDAITLEPLTARRTIHKTYALNACEATVIHRNDSQVIKFKLDVDHGKNRMSNGNIISRPSLGY